MTRILVVSDNEILNQLYLINLEVYLATQVTLVLSTQVAQEKIDSGEQFNLIITMNMINGNDSAVLLNEFLSVKNLSIPLVVVGRPEKELINIVVVPTSFNLQNLLRSCAQILGVTAKAMASLNLPDYYAIDSKFLARLKEAPCSIYLQIKKIGDDAQFTMIAKKDSPLVNILNKFSNEGIDKFYVHKNDRLLIVNQISGLVCDFIKSTEKLGVSEKSIAVEAGFDFVASDFSQLPEVTQEVMNIAAICTKTMTDIAKETTGLRALLQILNSNKNGYIYSHSMIASYISNHIVKNVSWGGESHIDKINFVLFFHDIMLGPIYLKHPTLKYEEDLLFSELLDEKEKELVLNHARLAAEAIITYKRAPMGADLLIKQHHGMTNGVGFAIDFKDDISPLSKIVLVSEAFVEEFLKEKDNNPNYKFDLKKLLVSLNEKFKRSTYRKIIETLETLKF